MVTHRKSHGPPQTWMPPVGDVALLGTLINLSYTSLLIYALANPNGIIGIGLARWVQGTAKILTPFYALAGHVGCGGAGFTAFAARAWAFDVHIVAVNLMVAAALFAGSRRYWARWSKELYDEPQSRGEAASGASREDAEAVAGTMLWAAIAALWWLTAENDLFDSAGHCATVQPWFLFRSPLLVTVVHGFAVLAASLWAGRRA